MRNVIKLGTNIEHLPQLYVEFERKIKIRRSEKMESILVIHLLYFIRKEIIFRKGMDQSKNYYRSIKKMLRSFPDHARGNTT